MSKFKLGVIVGSNRKLAQALVKLGHGAFDATFLRIDDLPMYNQDIEAEMPEAVARFKKHITESDALLFVTPEHHRSLPAVLKNAIDWGGRPYGKTSWPGKTAAITGTSPGAIGAAVAQQHLKAVLNDLGLNVMGGEAYITYKPDLVDAESNIADESVRKFLKAFVDQFAVFAARFNDKTTPRAAA